MKKLITFLVVGAMIFGLFSFAFGDTACESSNGEASRTVTIQVEYIPAKVDYDIITPESLAKGGAYSTAALMAQVVWAEARGLSNYHKSLVAWCILNRYDMGIYGDSIEAVIKAPYQFAYRADAPITQENYDICLDVLLRWQTEKYALADVGRTLPKQYVNFRGDGKLNYFTDRAGNRFSFGEDIYK